MDGTIAKRTAQTCYVIGDIVFLPHYTMPDHFVFPGLDCRTMSRYELGKVLFKPEELESMGATKTLSHLWSRTSVNTHMVVI
jgi:hypothetical protein